MQLHKDDCMRNTDYALLFHDIYLPFLQVNLANHIMRMQKWPLPSLATLEHKIMACLNLNPMGIVFNDY